LEEKPPPALVESAARESDATAPAPSLSINQHHILPKEYLLN
jgi:hypothetical protein